MAPRKKSQKRRCLSLLYVIIAVVLLGIGTGLYFIFRTPELDEPAPAEQPEMPKDSVANDVNTSSNDTLVIRVEGQPDLLNSTDEEAQPEEVEVKEEVQPEPKAQKPAPAKPKASNPAPQRSANATSSHSLGYGTWTGGWKNGKPHGTGTMTYSTSHTIDSRDSKGRVAQSGEYVIGEWDNGHLVQGRWFKKDGSKEAIIIGKAG